MMCLMCPSEAQVRQIMKRQRSGYSIGSVIFFALCCTAGAYFAIAGMQGDYGLFRRIQIDADAEALKAEHDRLTDEVAGLRNLTRRMSDDYLDLDLLDEQVRDVLGYVRADEVVIR
jgi:cell division protein FtsB